MTGHVTGAPKTLLRLEGLAVLALSAAAYARYGSGWIVFAAAFLAPDLFMLGYLGGRKLGAAAYNFAHSYLFALMPLAFGIFMHMPLAITVGLIWTAHIGFDRALGYGLKYGDGFGFTHLGLKGKAAQA